MGNDALQATLRNLLQSSSRTNANPALNELINDYVKYHVVLVASGGLLVVVFAVMSILFWAWRRALKSTRRNWTFERWTYFGFGALSTVVCVLLAFVVAVNATTVSDPRNGFSLVVDSVATPQAGTPMASVYQAFNTWVQSGSATMPALVQAKVHERTVFHTMNVVIRGALLVLAVALSTGIWHTLVRRSRSLAAKWGLKESALLFSGLAMVTLFLLLMVMVVANLQGALAPLTMVLLYG